MTGIPREVFDRIGRGGPAAASFLSSPQPWFVDWATGNPGGAKGPVVNEHTALNYAALYTCVSLIAGTIASLPLKVFRRREGGGQDEATERPEYDVLQNEFNPNTSSMTGRETGNAHLLTWGNSYAQVVKNKAGDLFRLQPLGPDVVRPDTNANGELEYKVRDRETGKDLATLPRDQVLHVPGLSFDAMCGYSLVRVARHAIRTGMAQDSEAEKFVTRGIRPPGAIKFKDGRKFKTDQEAIEYRDRFRKIHAHEDGSLEAVVLEDGADWVQLGVDPESAQLLESRKFSALEICGLYHVPPHMAGLVEKTTSWGTGIEELTIGFVVYCLLPTIRRIEQEYNRKLFRGDKSLFCEHVLSGLLRGDALKRAQALEIMTRNGVITTNEWRRLEGFNPLPGGNVRYFPLNMGRVDEDGEDIPPPAAAEAKALPAGPDAGKLAASLRKAFRSSVARVLNKETIHARRAAKHPREYLARLDEFYAGLEVEVGEAVEPSLEAWEVAFCPPPWGGALGYAAAHVRASRTALVEAADVPADKLSESVEAVVSRWLSDRLPELAAELQPGRVAP